MAVYSTNQNRQLYVVSKVVTNEPAALGEVKIGKTKDNKQLFFKYFGQGGLTRTDIIDVEKVEYAKITSRDALKTELKKAVIALDPTVNGGIPVAGQDYIVRIIIHNYLAPGDANVAIKHGAVHAYAGMDAQTFYEKLAKSLEMNFSREITPLLTFSADASGVTVTEVEQPWNLGLMSQESVNFEISVATVRWQGDDVIWAVRGADEKIEIEGTGQFIGDGKKIADLEYFCMGERGDQYRDNVSRRIGIPTKLMVDAEKEYDVLDLHYAFTDTGVNVQKSEKDITFVSESEAVLTSIKGELEGLGISVQED